MTPPAEKRCTACGETKTAEEFGYQRDKWGVGLYSRCRKCASRINSTRATERRHTDPDFLRRAREATRRSNQLPAAKARKAAERLREKIVGSPAWGSAQVRLAVKRGDLIKPTACEHCAVELPVHKLQGHHWHGDYAGRPLEVVWLCSFCHGAEHSQRSSHTRPAGEGTL